MDLQQAFDAGFEAVKAYVDTAVGGFEARIAALEKIAPIHGKDGTDGAPGRGIAKLFIDANGHQIVTYTDGSTDDVGKIVGKDGEDGKDGRDGAPGERGADGAVGKDGPPGRDGTDGKDGINGQDGKSVELDTVAELVRAEVGKIVPVLVQKAVDAIPRPADGKDGVDGLPGAEGRSVSIDDVRPIVVDLVERAVGAIPVPKDGKDGEPGKDGRDGKLPLAKAWLDTVHREGEVVTHEGGTYQANRDTGKAPPHADWTCLAAPGRNGADGRSLVVRGTHSEDAEYSALDLVAMNGGSFIAKRDNPGPCPGDGWQLVASQGKAGKPGDRGAPGPAGRGEPGSPVIAASIDGNGLLTLVNGDGSTVECDMYPVLAKIGAN